jgi:hypothetical protein
MARLYLFTLPVRTNAGLTCELARKRWSAEALKLCGGVTEPQAFNRGVWDNGDGQTYKEEVAEYKVAATAAQYKALLACAFDNFPDQEAIFTADLGEAYINVRAKDAKAA